MKKILAYIAALLVGLSITMTPLASAAPVQNLKDCDGVYSGTYRNVTVQPGGSCALTAKATVLGGVHAKKGAKNLYVHTTVGRNIQAKGVTGTVQVGPAGCKYDPPIGNNVHVSDSHNVLICWVAAKNNISVTTSDGRITVRDSSAGQNIRVDRNLAYVKDGGSPGHAHPGTIRLLHLRAGGHVTSKGNDPSRKIVRKNIVAGY